MPGPASRHPIGLFALVLLDDLVGHGARNQCQGIASTLTGPDHETVVDEIELYFERPCTVRYRGSGETRGGQVQCRVPPMVERRGQSEPGFADKLRPAVEGIERVFPLRKRQTRPETLPSTFSSYEHR